MSVVAVRVNKDSIIMSADSIRVFGGDMTATGKGRGKIYDVNKMLIGGVGYSSENILLSLFAENHRPLAPNEREVVQFFNEFAEYKNKMTGDRCLHNDFLLAFDGHCFTVSSDYNVLEIEDYFAIGYGRDYANAALYLGHSPQEAVKAACDLCCYVAEPIITFTQEK